MKFLPRKGHPDGKKLCIYTQYIQEHGRNDKNMGSMQKAVALKNKLDQTSGGASNLTPWPELEWSNSAKSGL